MLDVTNCRRAAPRGPAGERGASPADFYCCSFTAVNQRAGNSLAEVFCCALKYRNTVYHCSVSVSATDLQLTGGCRTLDLAWAPANSDLLLKAKGGAISSSRTYILAKCGPVFRSGKKGVTPTEPFSDVTRLIHEQPWEFRVTKTQPQPRITPFSIPLHLFITTYVFLIIYLFI